MRGVSVMENTFRRKLVLPKDFVCFLNSPLQTTIAESLVLTCEAVGWAGAGDHLIPDPLESSSINESLRGPEKVTGCRRQ